MRFATFFSLITSQLHPWAVGAEQNRHRHLLPGEETECVLYQRHVRYEDPTIHEESWVCEFAPEQAQAFGGYDLVDIEGIPNALFKKQRAVSGETILKVRDEAYVEVSRDAYHVALVVPSTARWETADLAEEDPRHHQAHRRHRSLTKTKGILNTLVVRVTDADNKQPPSATELYEDIFDDPACLKSQYAACSHDQAIIQPGQVGANGVVEISVDVNSKKGNKNVLEREALKQARLQYGGDDGRLQSIYDLVMFCFPPGYGKWIGWGYIGGWSSFYNNKWCQSLSTQMHEVGHNMGLDHSGKGKDQYGDESSVMGVSYKDDDGPEQCFSAADNYQLGWYELQAEAIDPLTVSSPQTFVMNGVGDYRPDGSSDGELITLRLIMDGDKKGADYYVGYNRAAGPNIGTTQVRNKVLIYYKKSGGPSRPGKSKRYSLSEGEQYTIKNYKKSGTDVIVEFVSLSEDKKDATVVIRTDPPIVIPTASPSSLPPVEPTGVPSASPTPSPTAVPTPSGISSSPTVFPTSSGTSSTTWTSTACADDPNFQFKGNPKKTCAKWVAKGSKGKIKKKCKKKYQKEKIWTFCPATCAEVGLGDCAS